MKCLIKPGNRNCENMDEYCAYCGFEKTEAERRKALPMVKDKKTGLMRKNVCRAESAVS